MLQWEEIQIRDEQEYGTIVVTETLVIWTCMCQQIDRHRKTKSVPGHM